MGLDMYLYRKNDKAIDFESALDMENAYWDDARWDDDGGRFASELEPGFEQIGYWRKANMVHGWFERNCGADNCNYYPVSRRELLTLLMTCMAVRARSKLVDGLVHNGSTCENGVWTPIMEPGKLIEDPSFAQKYLPTCEGFFFGSTDYDQWYMHDVEETIDIIGSVLKEYDDDEFYYYPSW